MEFCKDDSVDFSKNLEISEIDLDASFPSSIKEMQLKDTNIEHSKVPLALIERNIADYNPTKSRCKPSLTSSILS